MEDSGLLFTTVNGELRKNSDRVLIRCMGDPADVKLADSWAGELTAILRDDGLVHAAWTNVLSQQGYFLSHS